MKVLITGASGFIGRSLSQRFKSDSIETLALGRKELDLLRMSSVKDIMAFEHPDVVVHCAVMGNGRPGHDTQDMFDQNIRMYHNLKSQRSNFGCLINIGTGAEFDRKSDIRFAKESDIFISNPTDFYGHAKNIIARDITKTDNFFNLRIFGCFGPLESDDRLLKIAFNKNESKSEIYIAEDKEMDFIHVDDLAAAVKFFASNFDDHRLFNNVNVVYDQKMRLSEIVNSFIPMKDSRLKVNVGSISTRNYTGDGSIVNRLGIDGFSRDSLINSLEKYYNDLREIQRGKIEQT